MDKNSLPKLPPVPQRPDGYDSMDDPAFDDYAYSVYTEAKKRREATQVSNQPQELKTSSPDEAVITARSDKHVDIVDPNSNVSGEVGAKELLDVMQLPRCFKEGLHLQTHYARLETLHQFKCILTSVKEVVREAPLEWSNDGIRLNSMDPAHVAFVSLFLSKEAFQQYHCERTITIGLSLDNVSKAMACGKNEDGCMLKYDENAGELIQFGICDYKKRIAKAVTVKVMNLDVDHLEFPEDLEYDSVFEMESSEFASICRSIVQFSDTITIKVHQDGVDFYGKGEIGGCDVQLSNEYFEEKKVGTPFTTTTYSAQYMLQFSKASTVSPMVKISTSLGHPAVFEYAIEGEGKKVGSIRFCLAERCEGN